MIVAARCRIGGGQFETYAVAIDNGFVAPTQLLSFGRWTVRASIVSDNCDPIRVSATFRIDRDGDLVELRGNGEE